MKISNTYRYNDASLALDGLHNKGGHIGVAFQRSFQGTQVIVGDGYKSGNQRPVAAEAVP